MRCHYTPPQKNWLFPDLPKSLRTKKSCNRRVDLMLSVLTTIKEKDTWERPLSSLYPSSAPSSESVCFFTRLLSHFPLKFKITKYFLYPRKIVFLFIGRLINVKHLKAFKVIHQDFILGDNACYLLMYLIIYVEIFYILAT